MAQHVKTGRQERLLRRMRLARSREREEINLRPTFRADRIDALVRLLAVLTDLAADMCCDVRHIDAVTDKLLKAVKRQRRYRRKGKHAHSK